MKFKDQISIMLATFVVLMFSACTTQESKEEKGKLSDTEIVDIATRAYVYGYPLVLMEYTKRIGTNVMTPMQNGRAPVNQFSHMRNFPDHSFTDVVKPNVDTYYSIAFLDLNKEPLVMSVPASDRYYLLPMLDAYTNVFSSPGTRTTGNEAHEFLITGPSWEGEVPDGLQHIASPTNTAWIIGRKQVNTTGDGKSVVYPFQDNLKLVPMSQYGMDYSPPEGTVIEEYNKIVPVRDAREMRISDYFNMVNALMNDNPPYDRDSVILKEMASIGIGPGQSFDMSSFSEELAQKLDSIPEKVHQQWHNVEKGSSGDLIQNGWVVLNEGMGSYGTDYGFRAFIAFFGLGANLPADAIYPSTSVDKEGTPLNGANNYVVHFEKDQLPPVNAFWSLTAYDSRDLLVENRINRYALGDRNPLKYNDDGSLDIYVQNTSPGPDREFNWLPSPQEGRMNLTLRLYWPKEAALDGSWTPPAVSKAE